MMNAKNCLSQTDIKSVEQKIAGIESKSSAEIICAIATESGRYDRPESVFGLLFSIIGLAIAHSIHSSFGIESYSGEMVYTPFGWQAMAVVTGFIFGMVLASNWKTLRKCLTRQSEQDEEVYRAANHIFFSSRIRSTVNQNGMLIYLSLFEQRVIIRADDGILQFIPDTELHNMIESVIPNLKSTDYTNAFISLLDQIEEKLSTHLPIQENDKNELSNELLLFHPRP